MSPTHPTPDKGSIREIAMGEITVSITPDDHLESPYLLKTRELPGAPPPGPPAGVKPVGGARGARGAERTPIFLANPTSATIPEASIWEGRGQPPQMKILGGGANISFCPQPPNNSDNLKTKS